MCTITKSATAVVLVAALHSLVGGCVSGMYNYATSEDGKKVDQSVSYSVVESFNPDEKPDEMETTSDVDLEALLSDIEIAEKDGLSKLLGNLSRTVDVFVPEPITYAVGKVSSWLAELLLVREEGNKFPPDNVISNPQTGKVPGELSEDAILI